MNEEKNIETCLAESILAEVASVAQDPQFRSLVEESFDPLQQQALQQAGCDAYKEVVMYHQPYTFTSQVRQMKSNLILLLRRLWRFPFGRGTIRSFADMWSHYITRLSGNPEYGIPSRLDQLTDLPSAPLLLSDRKISGADVPDGMSLAHLLGDSDVENAITEINDDNTGWVLNRTIGNIAPNCQKATLRFKSITAANALNSFHAKELHMPDVETITTGTSQYNDPMPANPEEIYIDNLVESDCIFCQKDVRAKRIVIPKLRKLNGRCFYDWSVANAPLQDLRIPELRNIPEGFLLCWTGDTSRKPWTNLIRLEIGSDVSLNLSAWSPTNALDASRTDLIEEGSTAANNLEQFLQNFKTYIAERLTDQGSGKTLTLSQAVRNAIHAAESTYGIENIIITQKGWTISPAPN